MSPEGYRETSVLNPRVRGHSGVRRGHRHALQDRAVGDPHLPSVSTALGIGEHCLHLSLADETITTGQLLPVTPWETRH
jgi:hypothetical protein